MIRIVMSVRAWLTIIHINGDDEINLILIEMNFVDTLQLHSLKQFLNSWQGRRKDSTRVQNQSAKSEK